MALATPMAWVWFLGNAELIKCILLIQCKSLWIKASVKCINIEFGCRYRLATFPEGLIVCSEIFVSMFAAELEPFTYLLSWLCCIPQLLSDTFSSLYPGTAERTAPIQNVGESVGLTALIVYFNLMLLSIDGSFDNGEKNTESEHFSDFFVVSLKVRCSRWKQMWCQLCLFLWSSVIMIHQIFHVSCTHLRQKMSQAQCHVRSHSGYRYPNQDLGHIFKETSYFFQHIFNVSANDFANNFNKLRKKWQMQILSLGWRPYSGILIWSGSARNQS